MKPRNCSHGKQAWREAKQYYWCMSYVNAFNITHNSGCTDVVSRYLAETWADRDTEWQFRCPDMIPDVFGECDSTCRHFDVDYLED